MKQNTFEIEVRTPIQTVVSTVVRKALPARFVAPVLFLLSGRRSRLLRAYGYAASLKRMAPLDENGNPLPWTTYGLSNLMSERLKSDMSVLEFGGGYSTLYFMGRVGRVVSIEHDEGWAKKLGRLVGGNVSIVTADADSAESYCAHLRNSPDDYDLILIDGIYRVECFANCFSRLSLRGVVILDDSDRPEYDGTVALADAMGFKHLHFEGHKPGSIGLHQSTIYYRLDNCLGI